LLAFDLVFAPSRPRAIPRRWAWIAGLGAPLPVALFWAVVRPANQNGAMVWVVLIAPIVVSAGVVRAGARLVCDR
jgi:hypothetical protein